MRLATLASVRQSLRVMIGDDPTAGTGSDDIYNRQIDMMQQFFAAQFDWPFLRSTWTVSVASGGDGRYNDLPTETDAGKSGFVNQDRPFSVSVQWNSIWLPVGYGIGEAEFNTYDSDVQQVADPIRKWQEFDQDKFEVWPLSTSGARLRFTGQRSLATLQTGGVYDDALLLDLDDQLIFLTIAAEILAKSGARNAEIVGQRALSRFNRIRAGLPSTTQEFRLGGNLRAGDRQQSYRFLPVAMLAGGNANLPLTADQV